MSGEIMKYIKSLSGIALAVGMSLLAASASAATCGIGEITFELNTAGGADCIAGNDLGANGVTAQDLEVVGMTGWILGDSTDNTAASDGVVTFASAPTTNDTSGTWELNDFTGYVVMIVLKADNYFAGFSPIIGTSGDWNISFFNSNANGGQGSIEGKELSHASVYYQVSEVPLPASAFLLLAGIGGIAVLRRKKA